MQYNPLFFQVHYRPTQDRWVALSDRGQSHSSSLAAPGKPEEPVTQ
jgi:hypothetical protein